MRKQVIRVFTECVIIISVLASGSLCLAENRLTFSGKASAIYNEAVQAYRTRHFTLAIKHFKRVIEEYPDDGYAQISRSNLAQLYVANHEYEKAIVLYRELLDRISEESVEAEKIKMELCDLLYSLHRYRDGIEILEAWHKKDPGNSKCARKLASFYLSTGGKDEAWLLLERFMESGNNEAFKDLLDLAVKSSEVEKLINTLESRRAKYKSVVFADFLSDCYIALGRKDKAIEALKEVRDYKNQTAILRKLADILMSENKIDDSIEVLEDLSRLLPFDNQCSKNLGHCYFLQGKKEKAIALWRKQIQGRNIRNQQAYMNYTSTLIEHQLLEEALQGFDEARENLYITNVFAEEKAAVLMALNRKSEAMEEYLNVLMQGTYKTEIFDKLYEADGKSFDLEKRLTALKSQEYSSAITQSLMEYYFRKTRMADIDKVVSLGEGQSNIFFDDLFYNRLRQEALLVPEQFHFELAKSVMKVRTGSALELKLAVLMLKMPEYDEKWQNEAYTIAKTVAEEPDIADADLKYDLCLRLAEFAFYTMKKPDEADRFLRIVLRRNQLQASLKQQIEAMLFRARIYTYTNRFEEAQKYVEEAGRLIENADYNYSVSSTEKEEFVLQKLYEEALLKCHKGEFQEALESLKIIIDDHKEGNMVNDALILGNDILRLSIGAEFAILKHKLTAERAVYSGKPEDAVSELKEAVKAVPGSSTVIINELEAEMILASDNNTYNESLIKKIDEFTAKHKECFKSPDLRELKIRMLQRGNKSKDLINEEMQGFMALYPNDLRAGKYKHSLENGGKK